MDTNPQLKEDYQARVTQPMDFSTMKVKHHAHSYRGPWKVRRGGERKGVWRSPDVKERVPARLSPRVWTSDRFGAPVALLRPAPRSSSSTT